MVARAPRKRMYRTMQGRMVDVEKLRSMNENVRAIGNMSVNARGDVIGQGGQVIKPKEAVMREYYEQPKGRVDDTPARAKPTPPRRVAPAPQPSVQKMTPVESKLATKPVETFKPKTPTEKKGIDAALDGLE